MTPNNQQDMTLRDRLIDVFIIRQLQPNSIKTYLSIFDNFAQEIINNEKQLLLKQA